MTWTGSAWVLLSFSLFPVRHPGADPGTLQPIVYCILYKLTLYSICERSSLVLVTDGDQWQTTIWHENQWPVCCARLTTNDWRIVVLYNYKYYRIILYQSTKSKKYSARYCAWAKTVMAELRCNHFIKLTSQGTPERGTCVAWGKEMRAGFQAEKSNLNIWGPDISLFSNIPTWTWQIFLDSYGQFGTMVGKRGTGE